MLNILNKTKVFIFILIFTALTFDGCKTLDKKAKTIRDTNVQCQILDPIVNVTHDTIGSTSIFSSRKYGLYYNDYKTDEYAPVITRNGAIETLWFTSSRMYKKPQKYGFWNYFPIGWLFGSTPKAEIKNPVAYLKYRAMVTDKYHTGEVFYSVRSNPDGSLMPWEAWSKPEMLSTNDTTFDKLVRGPIAVASETDFIIAADRNLSNSGIKGLSKSWDLYELRKTNSGYISEAISTVNLDSTWESQPALSQTGDVLYFVSDRKGGKGGLDIWYSQKIHGNWSAPKPLNSINTAYDDTYPFCGPDGKFYFSSNRPGGKGGFDIYTAEFDKDSLWKNSKNINGAYFTKPGLRVAFPNTINTASDEISPFISDIGKSIYYSSNRSGGLGGFDLYACKITNDYAKPSTKNKDTIITLIPKVFLRDRCSSIDKEILVTDNSGLVEIIISDESGKEVGRVRNSEEFTKLKPNRKYRLIVDNSLYKCTPVEFTTPEYDEIIEKEIAVDVVGSHLGTIIFSDQSGVPYFITGYWRPLTQVNWETFLKEKKTGQLKGSNYNDNNYRYDTVPQHIDRYFQTQIYDAINSKLPVLKMKEITCGDSLILRISINGFTDAHGLDGIYTGKDIIVNGLKIAHKQAFQISSLKDTNNKVVSFDIDGVKGGQNGNVMLSMLRAYYTFETIHNNLMATSLVYRNAYDSNRVKYEISGKGIYKNKDSITHSDALMRRIEISLDAVPRDFDYEKQQDVKELNSYYVELRFENKKDAEEVKGFLERYNPNYFQGNNAINIAEYDLNKGAYRLYSNYFDSEGEAKAFGDSLQATFSEFPIATKKVETPIYRQSNPYVISLGVYQKWDNATKYIEKLSQIPDVYFEIEALKSGSFSIRTKPFRNYEIAQKNFEEIKSKLLQQRIPSFIKIIKL